jgi:hypothetical protein
VFSSCQYPGLLFSREILNVRFQYFICHHQKHEKKKPVRGYDSSLKFFVILYPLADFLSHFHVVLIQFEKFGTYNYYLTFGLF